MGAAKAVSAMWGGDDFGESLQVLRVEGPVVDLQDELCESVGTVAFVEQDVFLLLPYAPQSRLLADGDTYFFGLLDLHTPFQGSSLTSGGPGTWAWDTYFFMLKSSPHSGHRLMWCSHPNDVDCAGSVEV